MGSAGTHEHDAVTSYVTKVSRAENTVLSDERYRRAAAAGGVGVWDCNLETLEIYVDPALKQMLGYQDHEIQNRLEDCRRLVHPDDEATVFERAQAHIAGHTPLYEAEHRMLHRDGSIRWFIARGRATRDGEGRAISLAGTETDITERKRGEEALRQAEEINKRIVESTTDSLQDSRSRWPLDPRQSRGVTLARNRRCGGRVAPPTGPSSSRAQFARRPKGPLPPPAGAAGAGFKDA